MNAFTGEVRALLGSVDAAGHYPGILFCDVCRTLRRVHALILSETPLQVDPNTSLSGTGFQKAVIFQKCKL